MKYNFLYMCLIIIALSSCKLGTTKSISNSEIDSQLRAEINALDQKVLTYIIANEKNDLKSLMSDKLLELSNDGFTELINNVSQIYASTEYEIIDQYYITNSTSGLGNTLISGLDKENSYRINLKSLNKRMFVSLILPKGDLNSYYILNVYGQYPDGWKLNIIQFGAYTIDTKTAHQLYSKSKEQFAKGFLVDAANTMFLNSKVLKPSSAFTYLNENEMKNYYDEVIEAVKRKYKFPHKLTKIASEPEIFNIYPRQMSDGNFTTVSYLSYIDLEDSTSLRKENEEIHLKIGEVYKGIDVDNEVLLYEAFNQVPDGKTEVPTFGFVQKNKQNRD